VATPVVAVARRRAVTTPLALAVVGVLRSRRRLLPTLVCLSVAVAVLSVVITVAVAFRGELLTTLLGRAVSTRVNGYDIAAAAAAATLAAVSLAVGWMTALRERRAELAALAALGWSGRQVRRLVVTQTVLVGLAGALSGLLLAVALAAALELPLGTTLAAATPVAVLAVLFFIGCSSPALRRFDRTRPATAFASA
jgi:uncharacterized protein YacL